MANLTETNIWTEGIYRIETSDPVQGGEEGIDNRQAKQLGNRTQWLKTKIEALSGQDGSVTQILALIEAVYADVALEKGEADFDDTWLVQALHKLLKEHAYEAANIIDLGDVAILRYASIPSQKLGNLIYVEPFGLMRWNSKWEMYRSINAAKKEYGWGVDPEMGYVLGNGTYLPKNGNYKGLWTAAIDGRMVVPTASWRIGEYLFADVDAETFRLPDVRGRFDRNASMGSDVDTGRVIFSGQDDAMAQILGSFQSRRFIDVIGGVLPTPGANGLFQMKEKNGPTYVPFNSSAGVVATDTMYFDNSYATRTANENRPMNTAYPAWIKI